MAKLYFNYSSMNAGKSTMLLQSNHNYLERGMKPQIYTSDLDNRYGSGEIVSRIGLKAKSNTFNTKTNIYKDILNKNNNDLVDCVLVDEAQFLTESQVEQLGRIVDELNIPVLAFGIRTDFQGKLFEGSKFLLAWADNLKEIKTVCHCGRKATMVLRVDDEGNIMADGSQIEIGGEERYVSVCRKHFKEKKIA
ncbi:thymidine kinase [Gammaproteobacteria bacterium]|nr:thymidine kinase [SAR86 cluster bacterium]MDB3976460.1 thymidine kinase [Gammaproteobacteria bacterium]MDC0865381.1 thymidine kinase [bacterium]MDB3994284.1 thymidine kinase [Gammaproteobacteria bacterium]MDC0577177.1 thymidine kinase [Gammaproteobacteria bacterium]